MEQLYGTGVALATPFDDAMMVDTRALTQLVEHCIAGGVEYLVVLGTTAETATLTAQEKELVIQTVVKANAGRLPLVLGVGGNNTALVAETISQVDTEVFTAILSVSPYYNKPTQEGIYQHFAALAQQSPLPIILYNVPGRTASNMSPATVARLARDFDNIIGIKEACGDMVQVQQLIKETPEGFLVISGDDFTALSTVLAGGAGVISVLGQGLPADFSGMIRYGLDGAPREGYALHYAMQDAMQLIFEEGNPAGIKALLEHVGIGKGGVRLPLLEATPELKGRIAAYMGSAAQATV